MVASPLAGRTGGRSEVCAHSLFSKRLGVLPSASAARVCRLAEAGPRKALQCLSHPHRAPGVFAVAWGCAGRVLPFYVDGDSGNKRVSGMYHGDPLGSSRRGTQREWGGAAAGCAWGPHRVQASEFWGSYCSGEGLKGISVGIHGQFRVVAETGQACAH